MSLDKLKQKLFSNPEVEKEYEKLKPEFEKAKNKLKKKRK